MILILWRRKYIYKNLAFSLAMRIFVASIIDSFTY